MKNPSYSEKNFLHLLFEYLFNGMAEIALKIYKLPVFYKQRDLLFFPIRAYAIPLWILKIPAIFVEDGVFLTYYVIGFDPDPVRLFKHFLLLILVSLMASGLFRFIAAARRTMGVANTFGMFALFTICIEWICSFTR
ncbi:hypothetical protein P3S67_007024 [Capsicum chacoense]